MSLPASSYTPPGGPTVQGQQVAAGAAQFQSPAPVGNPATLPSTNDLTSAQGAATQQLAAMQTPQAKQGLLSSSDIPAMQSNYDDVAKQLYQYDQMHLAPAYANQPAQTSDIPAYGRVAASDQFQLTPEAAAGPATLFANDPKYAVGSQVNQQNNILDLLGTLSSSIDKEFSAKRGQYASTVAAQKSVVDSLTSLITAKNTKDYQDKSLQLQKDIANLQYGQTRQYHFNDTATQVRSEIQSGTYTNLNDAIKAMQDMYPEKSTADIKDALGNPTQAQIDQAVKLNKSGTWEVTPIAGGVVEKALGMLSGGQNTFGKFLAKNTKTGETKLVNSIDEVNNLNGLPNGLTGSQNSRPPLSTFNKP